MKLFRKNGSGSRILVAKNIWLPHLQRYRNLWIYLPPEYYRLKNNEFSLLYINDGQNVFDDSGTGSWDVDFHADTRWQAMRRNTVIVGIENGGDLREDEYLPWREGVAYARDWREAIHPFILKNFRVNRSRENTYFLGSSLGATILLEFLAHHQDLISRYAFFSPAVEVDYEQTMEMIHSIEFCYPCHLYVDIGTAEGSSQEDEDLSDEEYVYRADLFATALREYSGMPSLLVLDKDAAEHSESSWSARFILALSWLARDGAYFAPEDDMQEMVIEHNGDDTDEFDDYEDYGEFDGSE